MFQTQRNTFIGIAIEPTSCTIVKELISQSTLVTIKNNKIDYTQVIGNVLSKSGVPREQKD